MYPIIVFSVTGLLMLFLGLSVSKKSLLPINLVFLIIGLLSNFIDWDAPGLYFNNMVEVSNSLILVQSVVILAGILVAGLSSRLFEDAVDHPAEYYALMQFAIVGALIMVSFQNLIMLFVGLEILSVALYVLAGSDKRNLRGNEASIKYFLMGAFATGILLFGIAMFYGATGSFDINSGSSVANNLPEGKIFFWIGLIFIFIGLLFKISAAPFHFWTADVYQGSPTIFTAFMATIVKTAVIFALYRLAVYSFSFEYANWSKFLVIIIGLSMLIGNLTAVYQSNFKRILAYSSISQAGFMLLSLIGLGEQSFGNLGFYTLSYAFATISAFGVFLIVSNDQLVDGRPNENINVFNGLFKRNPDLAVILLISMLSLSGIPLTSGFWSKFFVLNDAATKGYLWILIVGIVMSAVSLYYYFKPIRATFGNTESESITVSSLAKATLYVCGAMTVLLGVAPNLFRGLF
ncbi:NADH-quinone oxidoreductase subunit N [Lacihabitans sp. CCS-44]|uniref:NADH-quinone oxidoreductase subunit N n=1 Tax=Lacihabitans sp. CCS-44 TaxID=2487331 RepID=UPI0020CD4D7F|nr:NADH-quinone oxidoreductase subunit N [Lacihabitans sp. CCS-44]MCP9755309.1 NADH-quinone oxidoreductase subunit N [Lacihabitans sp. CCS-44]